MCFQGCKLATFRRNLPFSSWNRSFMWIVQICKKKKKKKNWEGGGGGVIVRSASHLCHVTCSVFFPCWQWQEWTRPTLSLIGLPWGEARTGEGCLVFSLWPRKELKILSVLIVQIRIKVSFETAKGLLLFLYSHNNNEIMCFSKINKINGVRSLPTLSLSPFFTDT